jgi:hypothetical protein
MTFRLKYFIWFLVLLFIELYIALYIKDRFIRPYIGDVLVVILLYTFLRSFFKISYIQGMITVLFFSFTIEFSQVFQPIKLLNLEDCQIAHWVLGSSFNWFDFIAYLAGLVIIFIVEKKYHKNKTT